MGRPRGQTLGDRAGDPFRPEPVPQPSRRRGRRLRRGTPPGPVPVRVQADERVRPLRAVRRGPGRRGQRTRRTGARRRRHPSGGSAAGGSRLPGRGHGRTAQHRGRSPQTGEPRGAQDQPVSDPLAHPQHGRERDRFAARDHGRADDDRRCLRERQPGGGRGDARDPVRCPHLGAGRRRRGRDDPDHLLRLPGHDGPEPPRRSGGHASPVRPPPGRDGRRRGGGRLPAGGPRARRGAWRAVVRRTDRLRHQQRVRRHHGHLDPSCRTGHGRRPGRRGGDHGRGRLCVRAGVRHGAGRRGRTRRRDRAGVGRPQATGRHLHQGAHGVHVRRERPDEPRRRPDGASAPDGVAHPEVRADRSRVRGRRHPGRRAPDRAAPLSDQRLRFRRDQCQSRRVAGLGSFVLDRAGSGSGVWCRASQGGGGRHGGAMATDDNAARRGARAREPGTIQTRGPSRERPTARVRRRRLPWVPRRLTSRSSPAAA
ncbi:putative 3-oxoacyl-(acyl-carrier-protein) synthase, KASII [Streptomyces misionensis JCM 4497]